jgi:hypothetical protein
MGTLDPGYAESDAGRMNAQPKPDDARRADCVR